MPVAADRRAAGAPATSLPAARSTEGKERLGEGAHLLPSVGSGRRSLWGLTPARRAVPAARGPWTTAGAVVAAVAHGPLVLGTGDLTS